MSDRNKAAVCMFVVLLLTAAVLWPTLNNKFVNWDDPMFFLDNPDVREFTLDNTISIFKKHLTGQWAPVLPLTIWTFSIEHHLFGYKPCFYHLTNLLLHLCNTALAFIFCYALTKNVTTGVVAALLFGIHPIHVEPVAWITSRKDVLYTFFYLSALILYIFTKTEIRRKYIFYILSFLCFLLALLSKAVAVTFPLVLLLLDYVYGKKGVCRSDVVRKIPYFALAFMFGLLTMYANQYSQNWPNPFPSSIKFSLADRPFLASYALILYWVKLLLPFQLSCMYPMPTRGNAFIQQVYLAPVCLALILYLVFAKQKRNSVVRFGILFFLLTISPVVHLIEVNGSIIFDRFAYLPSLGMFLIVGDLTAHFFRTRENLPKLLRSALLVLLLFYAAMLGRIAFFRSAVWYNSETLWQDVIRKFPNAAVGYHNLGIYYLNQGLTDHALGSLQMAVYYKPRNASAYFNMGLVYEQKEDFDKAIAAYSKSLEINENFTPALNNRGTMHFVTGRFVLALEDFSKVIRLEPDKIYTIINRGMIYFQLQDYENALKDFNRALALDPQNQVVINIIQEIYRLQK